MQHSLFVSSSVRLAPRRGGAAFVSFFAHAAGLAALIGAPFLSDAELPPPSMPPPAPTALPSVVLSSGGGARAVTRPAKSPRRIESPRMPLPSDPVPATPSDEGEDLVPECSECESGLPGEPGGEGPGEGPGVGQGPGPVGPGPEPAVQPVRISSLTPPRRLVYVEPEYPEAARRVRLEGLVILECVIDARGRVSDVTVLRGRPLLDEAAVAAVRQWVYAPTLLGGVPVPVVMTVTVRFEQR